MDRTERWTPVPGYEGYYEVCDRGGQVRSLARVVMVNGHPRRLKSKTMKTWIAQCHRRSATEQPRRYRRVVLCRDGVKTPWLVHRLVLLAFRGAPKPGQEACHGPAGSLENDLENLRWGTSVENAQDILREGHHHFANRTVCPRAHRLVAPNVVSGQAARGHRKCLACDRAQAYISTRRRRDHPYLIKLKPLSDQYYVKIMDEESVAA